MDIIHYINDLAHIWIVWSLIGLVSTFISIYVFRNGKTDIKPYELYFAAFAPFFFDFNSWEFFGILSHVSVPFLNSNSIFQALINPGTYLLRVKM